MTDKQIIIDGCDVSGCEFYINNGWCCCALVYYDYCKDFNKCVYKLGKKLEAKEQECLELIERLSCNCFDPKSNNNRCVSYNRIAEDYERDLKQLDQLKAENEELKEQFKLAEPLYQACNIKDKKIKNYKQAIEKIKEMCSSVENIENANTLYESKLSGMYLQARKILQICDEVNDV